MCSLSTVLVQVKILLKCYAAEGDSTALLKPSVATGGMGVSLSVVKIKLSSYHRWQHCQFFFLLLVLLKVEVLLTSSAATIRNIVELKLLVRGRSTESETSPVAKGGAEGITSRGVLSTFTFSKRTL